MAEDKSAQRKETGPRKKGVAAGDTVIVVLHTPREKCWGLLDKIDVAGIYLRGLDLNAFDEWLRAIAHDEPSIGLSDLFFPMWRVERISRDESAAGMPSLAERFEQRTGRRIEEVNRE